MGEQTPVEDRSVSIREAAALFGVHRATLYRWVESAGLLPVETVRSVGAHQQTGLYLLSELTHVVADLHDRAARR